MNTKKSAATSSSPRLSQEQRIFLDAVQRDAPICVNDELAKNFGWTTYKSVTRVLRRNEKEFLAARRYTTRPNTAVPNGLIYELNVDGFKALMGHAPDPAMRTQKAMDYFVSGPASEEEEGGHRQLDDEDFDDESTSSTSLFSSESSPLSSDDSEEEDENDLAPIAKRRKTTSTTIVVTEDTIAAVMDRLADEAHKVQAANPECKFPVGVSAKTMAALGWTDKPKDVIREVRGSMSLTEKRDFEVSFGENRGAGLAPRCPVLSVSVEHSNSRDLLNRF
jgi:hypothetical protein